MSEWQLIETAPKDGTVVLGCEWADPLQSRELIVVEVYWRASKWQMKYLSWADGSTTAEPTHWMSRPSAPKPP